MGASSRHLSVQAHLVVLLMTCVTACGDISQVSGRKVISSHAGLLSASDADHDFERPEAPERPESPRESSGGREANDQGSGGGDYTAAGRNGEPQFSGHEFSFPGSEITPGDTPKGRNGEGGCEGGGCGSNAGPDTPAERRSRGDDEGASRAGAADHTGRSSDHANDRPDRWVVTREEYNHRQQELTKAIDDVVRKNDKTLNTGRASRQLYKPQVPSVVRTDPYPFTSTPQESVEGQRLAKAQAFRNAVLKSIPATDARAKERKQLVNVADKSLAKADENFKSDRDTAEFAMRIANLALNTAAAAKIEAWGRSLYQATFGVNPDSSKQLSTVLRGAAMVVTVGSITGGMSVSLGTVMAVAAGVATLGAILHAADNGSDIAEGLKQAEESAGKVIAAAEKLMGKASPDFEKFGEDLISQKRRDHILVGEPSVDGSRHSGGHLYPGKSGSSGQVKTIFPKEWDGDKIIEKTVEIVVEPTTKWTQQDGRLGERYTSKGRPVRWEGIGVREEVEIRVIFEPDGEGVITSYPLAGPGVTRIP